MKKAKIRVACGWCTTGERPTGELTSDLMHRSDASATCATPRCTALVATCWATAVDARQSAIGESSPGAEVGRASLVPRRCGSGDPGSGADVAAASPVPVQGVGPGVGRACPHRVVALGARRLCLEHDERVQEQVEAPELEEPLKPRRRPRRQRHAQREEHLPH
jgi:hypothetical protein